VQAYPELPESHENGTQYTRNVVPVLRVQHYLELNGLDYSLGDRIKQQLAKELELVETVQAQMLVPGDCRILGMDELPKISCSNCDPPHNVDLAIAGQFCVRCCAKGLGI